MEAALQLEPQGVQMTRHRPWRADHPTAVIVARPTRWGNPWRVGDLVVVGPANDRTVRDAEHAVRLFGNWIATWRRQNPVGLEEWLAPLRGRDLACWCPIGSPCHRDVLIRLANADRAEGRKAG